MNYSEAQKEANKVFAEIGQDEKISEIKKEIEQLRKNKEKSIADIEAKMAEYYDILSKRSIPDKYKNEHEATTLEDILTQGPESVVTLETIEIRYIALKKLRDKISGNPPEGEAEKINEYYQLMLPYLNRLDNIRLCLNQAIREKSNELIDISIQSKNLHSHICGLLCYNSDGAYYDLHKRDHTLGSNQFGYPFLQNVLLENEKSYDYLVRKYFTL